MRKRKEKPMGRYIHDDKYPVCWLGPDGRRHVGLASSNHGAKDHEHVTGWGFHPDDLPNHKVAKR